MNEILRKQVLDAHNSLVPPSLKHQQAEDQKGIPEQKSMYERIRETTMSVALGSVSPKPMLQSVVPGVEVAPTTYPYKALTAPADTDGHVHMAYYDEAGNGETDMIENHTHIVRSFVITPSTDLGDCPVHTHPGLLPQGGAT